MSDITDLIDLDGIGANGGILVSLALDSLRNTVKDMQSERQEVLDILRNVKRSIYGLGFKAASVKEAYDGMATVQVIMDELGRAIDKLKTGGPEA